MLQRDKNPKTETSQSSNRRNFLALAGVALVAVNMRDYLAGLPKQPLMLALSEVDSHFEKSILTHDGFHQRVSGLIEALNSSPNNRPNQFFAQGLARMREHGIKFELTESDKDTDVFRLETSSKTLFLNSNHIRSIISSDPLKTKCLVTLAAVAGAFAAIELTLESKRYVIFDMIQRGADFSETVKSLLIDLAELKVLQQFSTSEWSNVHQLSRWAFDVREGVSQTVAKDSGLDLLMQEYQIELKDLAVIRPVASRLGLIDEEQHVITF